MDTAYKKIFKYKRGFPKFKSRHNRQAIKNINCIRVNLPGSKLKVQKSGWLKFFKDREFEDKINSIVISRNTCNKYFASVLVDNKKALPSTSEVMEQSTIGIDVGIKDFAVLSDGKRISNPKYLEVLQSRLAYYQRRLSRKQKGSKRRKAAKLRVANFHYKIANQRNHFLHKESSKIVRENQTVIIEDLNVKGMMQNHKLARSIGSASWASFYNMLRYKCAWSGKNLIQIGRYEASTKTCHVCQSKNEIIGLKDRQWTCPNCNTIHDRDHNAAINIKNFGLKQYFSKKQARSSP